MCSRREPDQVYQPIADLDLELPLTIRALVYDGYPAGDSEQRAGAWVGAHAFYGLLENV